MGSTQSTWAIIFILCLIYSCTCGRLQTKVALEVDAQKTNEIEEMTENEHEDSEENMKMGLEESEEIEEEKPKKICTGRGIAFRCYTPKPPKKELTQEELARRLKKGKKKIPPPLKKLKKNQKKFAQDVAQHLDVILLNTKKGKGKSKK